MFDIPISTALTYLEKLDLKNNDIEILLGDTTGLFWTDIKDDIVPLSK